MPRIISSWKLKTRTLELGRRTLVMGIVNITPDSFSDGGAHASTASAIEHALQLLDQGADLLDLGAESTRPGSRAGGKLGTSTAPAVDAAEEQRRLLPVIEGILKARPAALLSIDTYKASTARLAAQCGAEIINDVSGFLWDEQMPSACAESGCGLVLMHTRGKPEEWRSLPAQSSDQLMIDVRSGLQRAVEQALAVGINRQSIVLDPGYGFGKGFDENYMLMARQPELLALELPLLIGLSRKSFLGRTLAELNGGVDLPATQRDAASLAAMTATILAGASIVRVHAVRPAVEAVRVIDALLSAHTGNA